MFPMQPHTLPKSSRYIMKGKIYFIADQQRSWTMNAFHQFSFIVVVENKIIPITHTNFQKILRTVLWKSFHMTIIMHLHLHHMFSILFSVLNISKNLFLSSTTTQMKLWFLQETYFLSLRPFLQTDACWINLQLMKNKNLLNISFST